MPKKTSTDSLKPKKPAALTEAQAVKTAEPVAKKPKAATVKLSTKKASTIKKFQNHANDTGSTDVQVAVLTQKIGQLSQHLSEHKKDNDSRSGLLKMISHRRSLLSYLEKRHPEQYRKILAELGLRK